ncbi:hypothetical protein THIAE_05475 [Thiomicrospira aerophila AL3]|uniref:Uncharacterized protein n=1 Tax=Thiomicrospira aerophila AL3 TaxID=717772 RepID=W0DVL7_9GAMM|nr:YcgN family cysteine cluster protein [Thiomicrospira aerophila]AHF01318.1 hypothetical protein THIAE_05475 [Thiomicrospira aerophila AL3]
MTLKYWQDLPLRYLNHEQWENLCDGCGLCCLIKLVDEDTGELAHTRVACQLMDIKTGLCSNYSQRKKYVPECVQLDISKVAEFDWLPETCAYRLRYHGLPLPAWHPLNTGNREQVKYHGLQSIPVVLSAPGIAPEDYVIQLHTCNISH